MLGSSCKLKKATSKFGQKCYKSKKKGNMIIEMTQNSNKWLKKLTNTKFILIKEVNLDTFKIKGISCVFTRQFS